MNPASHSSTALSTSDNQSVYSMSSTSSLLPFASKSQYGACGDDKSKKSNESSTSDSKKQSTSQPWSDSDFKKKSRSNGWGTTSAARPSMGF
ncbi:hypothetical protein FA13DRAFT_1784611 [Coprinellus micaceus]|uniref:Uncharacterized protein n=1 Tax=Coprinellus micaceus TaxID=71717 RepID=A0A4Y7U0K1_COPMI|nr:hypothetical protein FA13DRAFT_1784611 [Coprinellus micaceus]